MPGESYPFCVLLVVGALALAGCSSARFVHSTARDAKACVERVPIYQGIDYGTSGTAFLADDDSVAVAGVEVTRSDSLRLLPSGGFYVTRGEFAFAEGQSSRVVPMDSLVRLRSVDYPFEENFGMSIGIGVGWLAGYPFSEDQPAYWVGTMLVGASIGWWMARKYHVVRDCRVVTP
jgi:hypothetical protein